MGRNQEGKERARRPSSRVGGSQQPTSRIEASSHSQAPMNQQPPQSRSSPSQLPGKFAANVPQIQPTNFKFLVTRPHAIVIDLLGVLVCRSFMSSSKEFRDFFQHNVLEYLNDFWRQKQLKIMINFFRCSQQNVPDEFKLADRDESKDDQIRQARKHVIWKLRNDPTNSALSLFMLGFTEWGYKNKTLQTAVYDEVPHVLKHWKEKEKIPIYVGVGSADFLVMVLSNTIHGNLLPSFNGHMNIMDFDGTRANKDFKKLSNLLRLAPDKILYLTRFRQDCKRAMECGMQSLILLRPDFDSLNLIAQLKTKRGNMQTIDGTKLARGAMVDEPASPPAPRGLGPDVKNADLRKQFENNISSLSLIDDNHDDLNNAQSSQIVEQDLTRYSVVLSLSEIAFK